MSTLLKIGFGLLLACVPTAIIVALLSYDSDFSTLLSSIFSFNELFSHLFSLLLGIPFAMCIYSLLLCAHDGRCRDIGNKEWVSELSGSSKVIPSLSALGAVVPMLFVYVVFFISQWKYFISAFLDKVPENINVADYARNGFFELCGVSAINLIIIILLSVIVCGNVIKRVLSSVLSVFTLVLIATAISKMVLYIDRYGLTRMRVYPFWFMVLLAVVFIIILIKQFYPRLQAVAVSMAITVVMFTALSVCNVDGIIASYNVSRYIDGTLDEIDVVSLAKMGDAAVPALSRLPDNRAARNAIRTIKGNRDNSIWSFTIPREIAKSSQK